MVQQWFDSIGAGSSTRNVAGREMKWAESVYQTTPGPVAPFPYGEKYMSNVATQERKATKSKKETRLQLARKEWESPEAVAIRRAMSIVAIAVEALRGGGLFKIRDSEAAEAVSRLADEIEDSASNLLTPHLSADPLGIEAMTEVVEE